MSEHRTCARCGITDATVYDYDTGSACHNEPMICIDLLRSQLDAVTERAERMERVVQMLRIASVLPSPDLLTDGDWSDLCDAVRALDAEAQP